MLSATLSILTLLSHGYSLNCEKIKDFYESPKPNMSCCSYDSNYVSTLVLNTIDVQGKLCPCVHPTPLIAIVSNIQKFL